MTSNSSTSSSDSGSKPSQFSEQAFSVGAMPWGLLIGVLILILAEVWVRQQEPSDVIPYENTGRSAYSAVRNYLMMEGPADIAFLGSSRGREGIAVPDIRDALASMGHTVTVSNYSSPAASVDENEIITTMVVGDEGDRPRVVMYGMTMLQMARLALDTRHEAELWDLDQWSQRARIIERRPILGFIPNKQYNDLPNAIRLSVSEYWHALSVRDIASERAKEAWDGFDRPSCPIRGEYSMQQTNKADVNVLEKNIKRKKILDYLDKRMKGGKYPLGGEAARSLRAACTHCRKNGVPMVLFELPVSKYLRDFLPPTTIDDFRSLVATIAEEEGAYFIPLESLGETFNGDNFRDISHLNLSGAKKLSAALTERVIAPLLNGVEPTLIPPAERTVPVYNDEGYQVIEPAPAKDNEDAELSKEERRQKREERRAKKKQADK